MIAVSFDTAEMLAKYVNDTGIIQSKVVQIWCRDQRWWLFYYT